jgi:hypothetical protein
VSAHGRRTAEQRDEQQPSGWSGERYVHSHRIFAADAERIMAGQPRAAPLLELAERAEGLGFDSVWASAPAIADLKAGLADFKATLAELRITMAADKTQPLELPRLPPRELN